MVIRTNKAFIRYLDAGPEAANSTATDWWTPRAGGRITSTRLSWYAMLILDRGRR